MAVLDWADLRATVTGKLKGEIRSQKKHDYGFVKCGTATIGGFRIGHHRGDMKPWEIAGCAAKLRVTQYDLVETVRCRIDRAALCEIAMKGIRS